MTNQSNRLSIFMLCFAILLHNLTSSLPLPRGSPCPPRCVPQPCPQLPFVSDSSLRHPPEMHGSFFRTSLPGPLWSLLPSGRVLSPLLDLFLCVAGFLKYMSRQSRTRNVWTIVSDSVRPQRWQPTRLLHPWDSPGKNTGVGCHFLLQCMHAY